MADSRTNLILTWSRHSRIWPLALARVYTYFHTQDTWRNTPSSSFILTLKLDPDSSESNTETSCFAVALFKTVVCPVIGEPTETVKQVFVVHI